MNENLYHEILSARNWEAIKEFAINDVSYTGRMKSIASKKIDRYSLGELILTTNDYATEKSRTMDAYFKEAIKQKVDLDAQFVKIDDYSQEDSLFLPIKNSLNVMYSHFLAGSIEATHISGATSAVYVRVGNALIESYESPQISESDMDALASAGRKLSEAIKVLDGIVQISRAKGKRGVDG
jgi:hypothetical protein